MATKQEVLDKVQDNLKYPGTQVKNIINQVTKIEQPYLTKLKKGDVFSYAYGKDVNKKPRPAVIVKVLDEIVLAIPLSTNPGHMELCESKSRFFRDCWFTKHLISCHIDVAKERFLGVYDNPKRLNRAIKELSIFINQNL